MIKKLLLALAAISLFLGGFTSASETGIKFAINTQIFDLLKKADLSSKLSNITLIGAEGLNYAKTSFPSVQLKVANLSITKFENPENIEVESEILDKSMQVKLKGIKMQMKVSYDLKVISILKDGGSNRTIELEFDEFALALKFTGDRIKVKSFNFKLAKVDFSLNQFILNFVLKMFKNTIVAKINQSVEFMRVAMENKLNRITQNEMLIDLAGMGIGVNASVTEMPNIQLFDKNNLVKDAPIMQVLVDLVQENFQSQEASKIYILLINFEKKKFYFIFLKKTISD